MRLPAAIVVAASLLLPFAVSAEVFTYDLGVGNRDLTFSKGSLVSGEKVRIYARVTNHGTLDLQGYVTFYQGETLVGDSQVITVRPDNSYDDVWVDFTVPAGSFNIRGEIKGTSPQDQDPTNDVAISQTFYPLPDADGDGIADANDDCKTVANANQADRDHDGIGDVCDSYPDDSTNTPPVVTPPANANVNTNSNTNVNVPVKPVVNTNSNANVPKTVAKTNVNANVPVNANSNSNANVPSGQVLGDSVAIVAVSTSTTSTASSTVPAIDATAFLPNGTSPTGLAAKRLAWNGFEFTVAPGPTGVRREVTWDYGDGTSGDGEIVSHEYRRTGDFTVKVSVKSPDGQVSLGEVKVSIGFWNFGNWRLWLLMSGLGLGAIALTVVAARSGRSDKE